MARTIKTLSLACFRRKANCSEALRRAIWTAWLHQGTLYQNLRPAPRGATRYIADGFKTFLSVIPRCPYSDSLSHHGLSRTSCGPAWRYLHELHAARRVEQIWFGK